VSESSGGGPWNRFGGMSLCGLSDSADGNEENGAGAFGLGGTTGGEPVGELGDLFCAASFLESGPIPNACRLEGALKQTEGWDDELVRRRSFVYVRNFSEEI
jgi:hypothetical protein